MDNQTFDTGVSRIDTPGQQKKTSKKSSKGGKYSDAVRVVLIGLKKSKIAEPTRQFIDRMTGYANKPFTLKSLNNVDCRQRDSQRRVRERMIKILSTIITFMDWSTFRLGVAKPRELDPVKHLAMRNRYQAIYGEKMPESTWYRYIDKLVRAGYLHSEAMDLLDREDGKIKGVAGYKWLTMKLFKELGFQSGWLDEQREASQKRLNTSGLSNIWPVYASELSKQKRATALSLESHQTESTQGQFDTYWHESPPLPH